MNSKQSQKAGENSQQFQAYNIIVNNGIDEKRAREIVDEKLREVLHEYTEEATETARARINQFSNDLIPRLVKNDLLDALKDPSIQMLLIDAQKTAVSSERYEDYGLLSELLIHRAKNNNNYNVRASVSRAVKIVDEISDEALLGLTVAYAVQKWIPKAGMIDKGLEVLDSLFGKIIYNSLPQGSEWLEYLELLDCIKINSFGSLRPLDQIYSSNLSGYVDVGIDKASEDYKKALKILNDMNIPYDILVDHELRPGFVRLRLNNISDVRSFYIKTEYKKLLDGDEIIEEKEMPLTDTQVEAINRVYSMYNKDDELRNQNIEIFKEKWNKHNNLNLLETWWNGIHDAITITPVGRVLAHANAQRCDPTLPPLN